MTTNPKKQEIFKKF